MVGLIDSTNKVVFTGTEGEIDNLEIDGLDFQRTDDGVERVFQILDVNGSVVDEVDNIKEARNILRLDVENAMIVVYEA
jgi:hypothetical protein